MSKLKWHVGIATGNLAGEPHGTYVAFRPLLAPTLENYGSQFIALIGPFVTKRGAEWMAKYGKVNPHALDVASAEKHARHHALLDKEWQRANGRAYLGGAKYKRNNLTS